MLPVPEDSASIQDLVVGVVMELPFTSHNKCCILFLSLQIVSRVTGPLGVLTVALGLKVDWDVKKSPNVLGTLLSRIILTSLPGSRRAWIFHLP